MSDCFGFLLCLGCVSSELSEASSYLVDVSVLCSLLEFKNLSVMSFGYLERSSVPQKLEETTLNALPILEDSLAFLVPRHNHQVSERDNSVFDYELLIVVLNCSGHLE